MSGRDPLLLVAVVLLALGLLLMIAPPAARRVKHRSRLSPARRAAIAKQLGTELRDIRHKIEIVKSTRPAPHYSHGFGLPAYRWDELDDELAADPDLYTVVEQAYTAAHHVNEALAMRRTRAGDANQTLGVISDDGLDEAYEAAGVALDALGEKRGEVWTASPVETPETAMSRVIREEGKVVLEKRRRKPSQERIIRFTTGEQPERRIEVGFRPTFLAIDYPATAFLRQRNLPATLDFLDGTVWVSRFDETGFTLKEQVAEGLPVQLRVSQHDDDLNEEEELRLAIATFIEQAQDFRERVGPFVPEMELNYVAHQADEVWAPAVRDFLKAHTPTLSHLFWRDRGKAWGTYSEVAAFLDARIAELATVMERL